MRIAIIEDDKVEQIAYKRLFKHSNFEISMYSSFLEYEESDHSVFNFLISDYFVQDEIVKDWLHIFETIPGVIVSNAKTDRVVIYAGVRTLSKPLKLDVLKVQMDKIMKRDSFFQLLEEQTRFGEFCDTKEEALEIIDLLNANLEQAISDLNAGNEVIKEKYFYHNLVNQVQYFADNQEQIQFLKKLEQQLYDGVSASKEQHNELIRFLTTYSETLKNIIQHELSNN